MRKVAWKLYTDYEKEEKWLNDMAAKGLAFEDYCLGRYVFSNSKPGEYTYRIELLENSVRNPESQKYLDFMADNGVEPVASWYRWIYFRKKTEDGPFELYSDIDNKIAHFRRIMWLFFPLLCVEILIGITNIRIAMPYFSQEMSGGAPANFIAGLVCICVGIILFFPYNRARLKVKKLKQDKRLME